MVKIFSIFSREIFFIDCFFAELICGIHVRFQIRDVPGPKISSLLDFDTYSSGCTTIIFVLDATVRETLSSIKSFRFVFLQEDCSDSINLLVSSVQWMYSNDHHVRFEVLIHKVKRTV